jgi:hypothetical protein
LENVMVVLFATTIISCSDAVKIINRLSNVIGLSYKQKIELIQTVNQSVPTCPIKIVPDERPKSSN